MTDDRTLAIKFGKALKRLREARGWSQEDVAVKLNLSGPYISMLEAGGRTPSLEVVEGACRLFRVTAGEMLK